MRKESISLSVREAAIVLGVSPATLYSKIGPESTSIPMGWTDLRIIRIGQRIVIPRAELERVLCENENRGEKQEPTERLSVEDRDRLIHALDEIRDILRLA